MGIAGVSELVVGGGKLLKALSGDAREISREFGVFCKDHSSSSDEAVDQGLLSHLRRRRIRSPNPRFLGVAEREREREGKKGKNAWLGGVWVRARI